MKLFLGIYGPVVAVSHKSGLGSTFDGVPPVCGDRMSPEIAECESGVPGVPISSWHSWPGPWESAVEHRGPC